jgi:uncharacterized membrane protein YdjX (TVP38/TMEM64 family)
MPSASRLVRRIALVLFILAIATAASLLLGTEKGRDILYNPHAHGKHVHEWVQKHPITAPLIYMGVFVVLGTLALPVWWLQILAGYGFGLWLGILWSDLAATVAAVGAASISRFLLGEWFHTRIESHAQRLRALDEKLGHNGLLVVCGVRLAHFIPAGMSNYAFGLTTISIRDVAIGTLLGGTPTVAVFVAIGSARHLTSHWHFWVGIGVLNILLVALLAARYLRPEWFTRVGIE